MKTKQGVLEELISSMFNDVELRLFLGQMPDTAPVLVGVPGGSASPLQIVFETIRLLERRGCIDTKFFAALAVERPRVRQKIQEVAAMWGVTLPSATDGRTATPSSPSSSSPPQASSPAGSTTLPADVAILLALEEEWEVFWPIAGEPGGVKDDSGGYLYHFEVPCVTGRPYRCVALLMGAMGPGQATHATDRLLGAKPRTLVNLGIAAAIHDDLKLCDVVVAEQVDDFLATVKAVPRGKSGWSFELRGSVYRTTHALVQDLTNLKFAHRDAFARWRSSCALAMTGRTGQLGEALAAKHVREAPVITKVHLASGPVLAAAGAFSTWVRTTRDGLLKALEMEAAGMMLAAHQQADPARTLVLRGISDFGDERKSRIDRDSDGAFRYLAMFNATQLLWTMMHQGLLPRYEPIGAGSGPGSRPSSPRWDARAAVTRALLTEPNAVVRCLDDRLHGDVPKPGESARDIAGRVAGKVDALGEGAGAAKVLVDACYQALSDVIEQHPGDRSGAKRVLQAVLEEWLQHRYGSVLASTARPLPLGVEGCGDLDLRTPSPEIGEMAIAFAEGRRVAYETRTRFGRAQVEPRGSIPLPPGSEEMLTYDEIADHVASTVAEQIPARASDSPDRRRQRARARLEFLRAPGVKRDPKYVALSAEERRDRLPDQVVARLKPTYPALGIHALGTEDDDDENYILDRVLTIFEEDDEPTPGGAR